MKKWMSRIFVFTIIILAIRLCDSQPIQSKLAHNVMNKVANKLDAKYKLKYVGYSVAANKEHYKVIGLRFNIYRTLNKDEGRELIVSAVEELLNDINADQNLLLYLQPSPFTVSNIDICIFSYDSNRKNTFFPDISVVSALDGKVKFKTNVLELKYEYFTNEEESYAEALEIIKMQS